LLCRINPVIAQTDTRSTVDNTLEITSSYYGLSDVLVNGPFYYQHHRMANGSPFLYGKEYSSGVVFIDGREFNDVKLNYDISRQELVLFVDTPESKLIISLSQQLIDSLYVGNQLFVNSRCIPESGFPYLCKINNGKYQMFIGYEKEFINRYTDDDPYGRYSRSKRTMFISMDGKVSGVSSNNSLLEFFPLHRKEIRSYLKQHKIKVQRASYLKLSKLMNFCNNLLM